MHAIRRVGFLFIILFIGIALGTLGWEKSLLSVAPLLILWFTAWDDKKYRHKNPPQTYHTN